jgi:hypothetical protein
MFNQEQRNWCWAASAQMILHYYGSMSLRQCDLANWAFGVGGCCNAPSSSLCDQPISDAKISQLFSAYGLQSSYTAGTVPSGVLQFEIDLNRPVQVAYSWTGGGGHVAVVIGWDTNATGTFLRVNDPAQGSGGFYYSDLLTAYGLGVWDATWTNIRR